MIAAIVALILLVPQDETLSKFSEPHRKAKDKQEEKPQPEVKSTSSSGGGSLFDEAAAEALADALVWLFTHPFCDHGLRFQDYPFQDGPAYFTEDAPKYVAADIQLRLHRVEHDLIGHGIDATVRLPSRFDLHIDVTEYVESIDGGKDRLLLQQYEFNYGIGRNGFGNVHLTMGFGFATMSGEGFSTSALTLQTTFVWLAGDAMSFRFQAGWLGFDAADLTELEVEARIHFNRFAFLIGWRSLVDTNGSDLSGPTIGMSVFF